MELSDIIRNSFSIDKIYDEMYERILSSENLWQKIRT